ncbi:MAG: hypothetical protein IKD35_00045 [Clostridia bacterium]|nr:hypothetical protein [Clostridia bacterium]
MVVTFVCVGNTCRSPLLKHLFERYAFQCDFPCQVKSAGLSVADGKISPMTKKILLEHGIEVENQNTTVFDERLAEESDLIIAVTGKIADFISERGYENKVYSLSSPLINGEDMADPYGAGIEEYERIYHQALSALPKILTIAKMFR